MREWRGPLVVADYQFWLLAVEARPDFLALRWPDGRITDSTLDLVGFRSGLCGDTRDLTVRILDSADPRADENDWEQNGQTEVRFTQPAQLMVPDGNLPENPTLLRCRVSAGKYLVKGHYRFTPPTEPDPEEYLIELVPLPAASSVVD